MNRAHQQGPPHNRGTRGAILPTLPRAAGNQSYLTAGIGFHSECNNMILVRSKRSTNAIREIVSWWSNKMAQDGGVEGRKMA